MRSKLNKLTLQKGQQTIFLKLILYYWEENPILRLYHYLVNRQLLCIFAASVRGRRGWDWGMSSRTNIIQKYFFIKEICQGPYTACILQRTHSYNTNVHHVFFKTKWLIDTIQFWSAFYPILWPPPLAFWLYFFIYKKSLVLHLFIIFIKRTKYSPMLGYTYVQMPW